MKRFRPIGALLAIAGTLVATASAAGAEQSFTAVVADKLVPIEPDQVRLSGLLGKHVGSVPRRLVQGQREAYLQPFENPVDTNSWRAEHIGKWLEAACNYRAYTGSENLTGQIRDVVSRLRKAQQPDGWLGSYAPEYRFHKYDWAKNVDKKYVPFYDGPFYDVWCHYMTMIGLIRCYETMGDRQALEAAQKIADLLIATFAEGKQDLMLINHDHGFGPGVGIFPVSKLYLLTGDTRYRDFSRYIVSQYGRKGKVPILLKQEFDAGYPFPDWAQIKHCEFELCLAGMCQLHRATGDQDLFATCRSIYAGHFAPVMESMPLHGFRLAPPGTRLPDTYYGFLETCDLVPMFRWFVEMARITGDAQYLDALECNLYNSFLSRDLPDGRTWPGVDVPNPDFFHCCYSMLTVGLSFIPNWVYFTTTNGLLVNLYEPSVLSTRLSSVTTRIEQITEYPLNGTIDLSIQPEKPVKFDLLLRIPHWCRTAQVLVNGQQFAGGKPQPGKFLRISGPWSGTNIVRLVLDMTARAVCRELAGSPDGPVVSVQRGPLLLALTAKQNAGLNLRETRPFIEPDGTVQLEPIGTLQAIRANTASFRTKAVTGSSAETDSTHPTIVLSPYAYSGVSDKPKPPDKPGIFNVYSEDGVGSAVRVEFPVSKPDLK
jgi:uncharacterized protein